MQVGFRFKGLENDNLDVVRLLHFREKEIYAYTYPIYLHIYIIKYI